MVGRVIGLSARPIPGLPDPLGRSAYQTGRQARWLGRVDEQLVDHVDLSLDSCMVEGGDAHVVSLPAIAPF